MVDTKNELQAFSDSASEMAELDAALKKDVENGNLGGSGGLPILKLNQDDGRWYAGKEGLPIDEPVIVGAHTARHGHVSWVNRQKTGEVMVAYKQPLPAVPNDGSHAWQKQVGFNLVLQSDPSFQMRYDVSSVGGKNLWEDILKEIEARPSLAHPHPVIALSSTTGSKGGYTTRYPLYTLVGWASDNMSVLPPDSPETDGPGNDNSPAPEQRPQRRTRSAA